MNRGSREELLGSSQEALRNSQHDIRQVYEKPLTKEEKTFLLHADRGDYVTVKRYISLLLTVAYDSACMLINQK